MKSTLPTLLSLNAGYVDTAGFLALHGLFTAHVTGNFVTIGAALALGTSGVLTKLLALPVFCAVVIGGRLIAYRLPRHGLPVFRTMLVLNLLLLTLGAIFAIWLGPFPDGDSGTAMLTGMTLVAAMAIQNAVHRVHMTDAPPTTLMTGTTTQIMIDLADCLHGVPREMRTAVFTRMRRMVPSVLAFALGCAGGAVLFSFGKEWCFVVPPVVALVASLMPGASLESGAK